MNDDQVHRPDRPIGFLGKCVDGLLALTLLLVPLVFSVSFREYASLKSLVMMLLLGPAIFLAALETPRRSLSNNSSLLMLLLACYICGLSIMHPSADSLGTVGYLLSLLCLWYLLSTRAAFWPRSILVICLALPMSVDLVLSSLQILGIGVLPATTQAFGTNHGLLVGTIGNPNENTWYLVLVAIMLFGLSGTWSRQASIPKRSPILSLVFVLVTAVTFINRSKAALLALTLAGVIFSVKMLSGRLRKTALVVLLSLSLTTGLIVIDWNPAKSLSGRLYLARISAGMIADNYGLAGGPGDYAREFPLAQAQQLAQQPNLNSYYSEIEHAHFDILELSYELGIPGLLLLVLSIITIHQVRRRRERQTPACVMATFATGALLGIFGYLLFSPAAAMVFLVAGGFWTADSVSISEIGRGPKDLIRRTALLGCACILILTATLGFLGEHGLTSALDAIQAGDKPKALSLINSATRAWPSSDTLFYRANIELAAGMPRRATQSYRTSFALRPRPQTAHNLWLVLEQLGHANEAESWRQMASSLKPLGMVE